MVGQLRKACAFQERALDAMIKCFLPSNVSMAGREQLKELQQAAPIEKRSEKLSEMTMVMGDISEAEKMSRCMGGVDPRARGPMSEAQRLRRCPGPSIRRRAGAFAPQE